MNRTETVSFAATVDEKKRLVSKADERGMTLSAYLGTLHRAGDARTPVGDAAGAYVHELLRSWFGESRAYNAPHTNLHALDTVMRALQHETTSDTGGLLPAAVIQDLTKFVDANRGAVNASRQLPMPEKGAAFTFPRSTQATQVDVQASQGSLLASRKLLITDDSIAKGTFGGQLSVSEQEADWSSPALMQLATEDITEQYAIDTEGVTTAAIAAAITTNTVAAELSDVEQVVDAVGQAQAALIASAKRPGDVLFIGSDMFATLTGAMGQLTFPELWPSIAYSAGFAHDFAAVACSRLVRTFEQDKGLIIQTVPNTTEVLLAYRGYFAADVRPEGVCGIVAAS